MSALEKMVVRSTAILAPSKPAVLGATSKLKYRVGAKLSIYPVRLLTCLGSKSLKHRIIGRNSFRVTVTFNLCDGLLDILPNALTFFIKFDESHEIGASL